MRTHMAFPNMLFRVAAALLATSLMSFASHAAAQSSDDARFKGVTLRVATWGGATRDALRDYVASELEKRGAKVEFVIGSPQDNLAKLIAARGQAPFDLYEFLGTMRPEVEGRNLLAKMNFANLPNAKAVGAQSS